MYNKTVLEHFQNPRNLKELKAPNAIGMGANPICGDVMTLYFDVKDGRVKDAAYKTMGCGAAIASGSILTEMMKGKTLDELKQITPQMLLEALGGLPKIKLHCPELAVEALRAALKNFGKKQ